MYFHIRSKKLVDVKYFLKVSTMIKGLCETPWSSQADALHTFKGAYQRVIDTCEIW